MKRRPAFAHAVLYAAMSATVLPQPAVGAPLSLSTAPAGTGYRPPAPNVIVSVDDSGSMGASGMASLRDALRATFAASQVPDGEVRLAWQAMTSCYQIPSAECNNLNVMKVLDSTHRANFMTWVDTLVPRSGTPSHRMLRNAGEYLKNPLDLHSAWASVPGTTLAPVLGCRRSFSLFMTDGGWNTTYADDNNLGNADGTATTLPDGTRYGLMDPATKIYRDNFANAANTFNTTLSDLAFHYWSTDLQPTLTNRVSPKIKHMGSVDFTAGGVTQPIPQYWNPRNDPATWQHLNMYTVGFNNAANWTIQPTFGSDTWTGGDYARLIAGDLAWPNPITGSDDNERITELWHMALNSRGKFIRAPNAKALVTAFQDVLNEIISDKSAPVTSLSASSQSTRLATSAFSAGYDGKDWSGYVTRYDLTTGSAALDPDTSKWKWGVKPAVPAVPGTQTTPPIPARPATPKSTANLMDEKTAAWPTARLVLSSKTETVDGVTRTTSISWIWTSLSTEQQNALKTVGGTLDTSATADATAMARMDFLRGSRTRERDGGADGIFRNRGSRHGDIVNSKLWYLDGKPGSGYMRDGYPAFRSSHATRPSMLYVGANDGMLHGFDAATGEEKIAYVPEGLIRALPELTRPTYAHRYFVDGSPFTGDLRIGSEWKTYLAGFLGAGGKGYFVLDVTDPSTFAAANANNLVVMDRTGGTMDNDIGQILADPVTERSDPSVTRQIARLNNGRWALVTGNGYNSSSEKAVLLIQYLDGAKELFKITADGAGGNGNGLSAPRMLDLNGDKIPDVAYAGDLLGNLWKFDLSSASSSSWNVAFSGTPLLVARTGVGASAARQPITTAPAWLAHPKGGLMILFGTGQNLTNADRTSTAKQTLYGLHDHTPITRNTVANPLTGSGTVTLGSAAAAIAGRSSLVEQTTGGTPDGTTTDSGSNIYLLSSNPVDYNGATPKRGWFMDLPESGERLLENIAWFDGDLIDARSVVPAQGGDLATETCDPPSVGGRRYRTVLNALNGSAPKSQIFAYAATDANGPGVGSRVENGVGISIGGEKKESIFTPPGGSPASEARKLGTVTLRPSWRQLQ
ncbi:MAG: hypothetical protein EOP80_04015 [Variovorax sp.]|nr:MAG: hypothetical protein EOP80_04015 [Variovorax sp.]